MNKSYFNLFFPPNLPSIDEENFISGEFNYINDKVYKIMLVTAWKAITITKTWNYIKKNRESFTFANDEKIQLILKTIIDLGYDGHSGNSFGLTMRNMQFIANYGEVKFKKMNINQ